jgi:hypothetical protein
MEGMIGEVQLAAVSLAAALLIGGIVALFGVRLVAGAARLVAEVAIKRRIAMSIGATAITGLGALGLTGFGETAPSVSTLMALFG